MGFAIFEDDAQLSRVFDTHADALSKAEKAGLLTDGPDGKVTLEDDLSIRPCPGRAAGNSDSDDLDVQIETAGAQSGVSNSR